MWKEPRGGGQRSWTQGWRSQTGGEIFKGTDGACADPGTQNFPCHGGGSAAFQLYQPDFHGDKAGSLFLS